MTIKNHKFKSFVPIVVSGVQRCDQDTSTTNKLYLGLSEGESWSQNRPDYLVVCGCL